MKINTLLEGPTGTGKTHALRSLTNHKKTFVVATEPGIEHVLGGIPCDRLHWTYIPPAAQDFSAMIDTATRINNFNLDVLIKQPSTDKPRYQQYIQLLTAFYKPKCLRCGEEFPPVDSWTDEWAVVLDSLTGPSKMAMDLIRGSRPGMTQPEWGAAQDLILNLVTKLAGDTKCSFILTAHVERETDEVTMGTKVTVSTLGKKLAPKIPPIFDDVVLTRREGTSFFWDTANSQYDLKSRKLPIKADLVPSFDNFFGGKK